MSEQRHGQAWDGLLSHGKAASGNMQKPEHQQQAGLAEGHLWEGRVGALASLC